jgi:hypothetical protein
MRQHGRLRRGFLSTAVDLDPLWDGGFVHGQHLPAPVVLQRQRQLQPDGHDHLRRVRLQRGGDGLSHDLQQQRPGLRDRQLLHGRERLVPGEEDAGQRVRHRTRMHHRQLRQRGVLQLRRVRDLSDLRGDQPRDVHTDCQRTGQCAPSPPCGNTGTCTNGACTQGTAGQMCSGFGCNTAGNYQPAGTCNGSGGCSIPPVEICAPLICSGGCLFVCADDSQCIGTHYCNGGTCLPKKSNGDACGRDGECGSTHCTEGVCCNSGCGTSCESCKVPGFVGMCHAVPSGGADPTGTCVDQRSTCGTKATCDGAGSCGNYEFGDECMTSCDGVNVTHTYCDVFRTCSTPIIELCLSLMCSTTANVCI